MDAKDAPDFWVLVQIHNDANVRFVEKFFVLTHKEICEKQKAANDKCLKAYSARHGQEFDISKGVDEIAAADVAQFENEWPKIVEDKRLKGRNP